VVEVEALAEGQAVDPELGAQRRARGGEFPADQVEFATEGVVDLLQGLGERARSRRPAGRGGERDHGDGSGGLGLVFAPTGICFDQAREDLVALGVP
jgi:hypothetical protein